MKNIFKKPLLIGASTVLPIVAVITPTITLTSCSKIRGLLIDDIDEETGVSSIVYDSMKREFRSIREDRLRHEMHSEDEIKEQLSNLDDYFSQIDNLLNESMVGGENQFDYTAATMALSEKASEYNILLNRRCTVTMSSFTDEYNQLRDSTYTYMRNQGMYPEQIERILEDCDDRFEVLLDEVDDKYHHDPLLGITKSQDKLLDVFKANNAEVALVAGINKLSDFTSRYTFTFREDAPDWAYYDKLSQKFNVGDKIEDGDMNSIFLCFDKQRGSEWTFSARTAIPTFIVTPYVGGWYEDKYSNQYGIEIDWRIYPESYEQSDLLSSVTAHVYGKNEEIESGQIDPKAKFNDVLQQSEILFTRYHVKAHDYAEVENLKTTYFNPDKPREHIYLNWEGGGSNDKNKYEAFFDGMPNDDSFKGILTAKSLANSGLRISSNGFVYEDLATVMDRVDMDNQDPEHARPDDQLSLSDKFVKYCIVKSEVTSEDGLEEGGHMIHHNFTYQYGNSTYGNSSIVPDPDYAKDARRSDGFKVSKEFFTIANEKYNDAYSLFKRYRDNEFFEIKSHCNDLEASFVSTTCMTAVQIAKNVLKMFFEGIAGKLIAAYTISLLTANAVVLGIIWPFYTHYMIDPIDTFIANVKKLHNHPAFLEMQARLATDNWLFCVRNSEGRYPFDEYKTKEDDFRTYNFITTTRPAFQYYSTIMDQQAFINFKNATKILHCSPKDFKNEFGTWMYTGQAHITIYGYSAIRMLLNQLLMPKVHTSWALFIAEFAIETLLGMNLTKILQETAFKYDYKD